MRSPRLLLVLPLLAAAALPVTADAGATKKIAVPCWDADASAWTYEVKPKTCGSYEVALETTPFDITNLTWKKWGTRHAVGTGKVSGEGYQGRVNVDASALKRCSAKLSIYTKVYVSIPKHGDIAQINKVPCPGK